MRKLLTLCILWAMFCVPASAEDAVIDTSLIMFGYTTLTVGVDGELSNALSDQYIYGDVVTITAPDVSGKSFSYWTNDEGAVISYNKELTLTVYANVGVCAVYGTQAVTPKPAVEFLSISNSAGVIFLFNVMATAPSGSTITEYGIRYSTTKSSLEDLKGSDGVTALKADGSASNWLIDLGGDEGTTYYVVAYAVSGGQTYYSKVRTVNIEDVDCGFTSFTKLADIKLGINCTATSKDIRAALEANVLTINFDANQGSGIMKPQGFVKNAATRLSANRFIRTGYSFKNWNTKADGTGTSYADEESVSLTDNLTLYAQWQPSEYTSEVNGGSVITADGLSRTFKQTVFRKVDGQVILSADIAIITESDNFTASVGSSFSTTISVDVAIDSADTYTSYAYSMDLGGLPEWLKVSGELASSDNDMKSKYHHEFILSGTPESSAKFKLKAMVKIAEAEAGSVLTCDVDKTITLTTSSSGGNSGTPSDESSDTPEDSGNNTETPSNGSTETPADSGNNREREVVEVPSAEIQGMTGDEVVERFQNTTELALTGEVPNLAETIARLETLTGITTLDLSQVSGVTELKLENTTLESINLEGNQSITTVELTGSQTLTTLNVAGAEKLTTLSVKDCAKLEILEARGCEYLEAVNLEGCESLQYLDVSETAITELDVQGCANLGTLYCASCRLEKLETEGCEKLQDVDCRNNRLTMLDASEFVNLGSLECGNQRVQNKPLSRLMNFIDFLLRRGIFSASEENSGEDYASNVKNLRGYDAAGANIPVEYDPETGEAAFSVRPSRMTYDYVTGFQDVMMDVEVSAASASDVVDVVDETDDDVSSSGGCGAVIWPHAFAFLLLILLPKLHCKK